MGCRIIRRNQEVKADARKMPVRYKAEVRQRHDVAWKGIDMSTLWVIGDSTLSSFNDKYYYPRYGYGTKLGCYLNDKVTVRNIALSGRSSKSYKKEPEYKELLENMKQGDFLIIGFGHNDEKTEADIITGHETAFNSHKKHDKKTGLCLLFPFMYVTITKLFEFNQVEIYRFQGISKKVRGEYHERSYPAGILSGYSYLQLR